MLYEQFFDPVYWFCKKRLGTEDGAAEDVAADVFTVVWRLIAKVPPPPNDRVFVYAIAFRQLRNQQRRMLRWVRLQHRLGMERALSDRDSAVEHSAAEGVQSALAKLPDGERDALLLVVVEGFSHAEAGQLLDCSANAIAVRIHKARTRLRVELTGPPALTEEKGMPHPGREGDR